MADNSGNSYVTGNFGGSLTFGVGEVNQATITGTMFVAKYNSDGSLAWAQSFVGSNPFGTGIALDGFGKIHVSGIESTTPASVSGRVAKYNSDGTFVSAKTIIKFALTGIAVDSLGNGYVTGLSEPVFYSYRSLYGQI